MKPGSESRSKHPKLYWSDNGVARAARGDYGQIAGEERGALFESWIAQVLRSYQSYRDSFDELYYWSSTEAKDVEVDFLLKRGRRFVAIEAKSGTRFRNDWLKNLRAISTLPGLGRRIVVYAGRESMKSNDGIEIMLHGEFCEQLDESGLF